MSSNDPVIRQLESQEKRLEEQEKDTERQIREKKTQEEGIKRDLERREADLKILENKNAQLKAGIETMKHQIADKEKEIDSRERLAKEQSRSHH